MYAQPSVRAMSQRRDLPRLLGQGEIRERLGYSRQWTAVIIGAQGFPEPAYVIGGRRIWLADEVERWIADHREWLAQNKPESEPDGE